MPKDRRTEGGDLFIVVINETIKIMKKIDETVDAHGG
jgi:hypothetical protein